MNAPHPGAGSPADYVLAQGTATRDGRTGAGECPEFTLPVPVDARADLALGWLALGVAALAGSGLFAVLLVLARTPGLQQLFPVADFFRVSLVVHVDLSVLVWFVASAGAVWSVAAPARLIGLGWAALAFAALGCAAMLSAPFLGRGSVVMSNYVPVLDSGTFLYGLALIGVALALLVVRALAARPLIGPLATGAAALRFGLQAAAVSAALAIAALAWSWWETPLALDARAYYETLFWGAGHIVQFTWTLLLLVGWLWLASLTGARVPLTPRVAALLLAVGLMAALLAPLIYLRWPVIAPEHHRMFTWLMRFGGGLAILPIGLAVAIGLARGPKPSSALRPLRTALLASMLLFALGGAIGFLIRGSDVRIPAHYHGSIVGVTLALMGLAYALAPKLGGRHVQSRLACWQVRLYATGQLLHVAGLLWSGGYGVQRKVAGAEQMLHDLPRVAGMALMGAGGLIAVAGGVLFVIVMAKALQPAFAARAGVAAG